MYLKTLILICLLGSSCIIYADEFKIAVIDMEKVFQGYYKTKIADANLKKQAELFKKYAMTLNSSKKKLEESFKLLRDASQDIALSEAVQKERRIEAQDKYRQLEAKGIEFKQYNIEKQRLLRNQYDAMRKSIIDEIKKAVRLRCALEGYSLVLDLSGKTLNNIPAVIYHKSSLNITDEIIAELNKKKQE